jgi:hypothetical protein
LNRGARHVPVGYLTSEARMYDNNARRQIR